MRLATLILILLPVVASLAGCERKTKTKAVEARPVRTITAEKSGAGETVMLTGQISAENEVVARLPHRRAHDRAIGRCRRPRRARPGGGAARSPERAERAAFGAGHAVGRGRPARRGAQQLRPAGDLLPAGSPRGRSSTRRSRRCRRRSRRSTPPRRSCSIAQDRLSYTELTADAAGVVTARGAEPGEVVQAGRMIVQVARQGGRDAVFDVPAQVIRVGAARPADQRVADRRPEREGDGPRARGRAAGRSGDPHLPGQGRPDRSAGGDAARLHGRRAACSSTRRSIDVPATALTRANSQPAVWVVDPATPRSRCATSRSALRSGHGRGLAGPRAGEVVVTAGVQALHPGQKVRLLGAAP